MRLSRLSPACLPVTPETVSESFVNVRCIATGWGHTSHDEAELQDDLHEVDLRVTPWDECEEVYTSAYNITLEDYHLCASPEVEGQGTCVGDSGGPLHCNMGDGHWYLAGITSFGSGCAKPGFPDVFTRITSYTAWIRRAMTKYATFFPIPKHKTFESPKKKRKRKRTNAAKGKRNDGKEEHQLLKNNHNYYHNWFLLEQASLIS